MALNDTPYGLFPKPHFHGLWHVDLGDFFTLRAPEDQIKHW